MPLEVEKAYRDHIAKEHEHRAQFGDVRPIIHTDFQGHKFVVVGTEVHWSKSWRFFTDFLQDYIKKVLGAEWGNAELAKDHADRHVIIKWYDAFCEFQKRHPIGANGVGTGEPDGPAFAYLTLAYDLYLLRDHMALRKELVERLKSPEAFQGARYELYVATTMIRAGFKLELENERDPTRKHPEFLATHRETKEVFAVEAKSRHLPGVLGREGSTIQLEAFRLDVRQLVKDAIAKDPTEPYIVFVDANMPPSYARDNREQWVSDVHRAVELADPDALTRGSAFNLMVVTNVPHHYGRQGGNLPDPVFYRMIPAAAHRKVNDAGTLEDIERSLSQSYAIPSEFPED